MADIKLESDYWETAGIRDRTQNKTQRQINASLQADITDIQSDIGDMDNLDTQATNLVGAANELKGSLNTKVLKAAEAVQVPAQGANSGWVTLNGLTSNHELINWNFSTLGENQKLITIQCETDTDRFRISTLANYPPPNETCQPFFVTPL